MRYNLYKNSKNNFKDGRNFNFNFINKLYYFNKIFIKNNNPLISKLKAGFKNYVSIFYFFIPVQDLDFCNSSKNKLEHSDIKFFKKIRFKPGYQVLLRFFRKKWTFLYYISSYRQKRLTKEIYLFSCNNYINYNEMYLFNKKTNVYKDPSKQLLNWKYIV